MESFSEVLNVVKDIVKADLSDVAYNCWILPMEPIQLENNNCYICVPNEFHRNILENQYKDKIKNAFMEILGFPIHLKIMTPQETDSLLFPEQTPAPDAFSHPQASPAPPAESGNQRAAYIAPEFADAINEIESQEEELQESLEQGNYDYTFDTFIVGSSNNFAYAACKAVAQKSSAAYNPLFIHGPSGLGKTHLLHAIKYEFQKNNPNANIIYVSTETFTNELIFAITKKSIDAFHNKYRKADILLIDDIQFLTGKESTQEEFFHTFNELHQVGKQIVLTSDRPPKDIKTLEDRLRTRFEWGLLTDISLPDFETRIAIIQRKADLLNIPIPDDVAQYIANKLRSNIRQLEGAVKKIKAFKYYNNSNPSISVAQKVVEEILTDNQPAPVTVERIIQEVAKTYSVSPDDIRSTKRASQISIARQISIYIVQEITQMSQSAIGEEFGGRDHATIFYALQKVQKLIEKDSHTKEIIEDIIKNIKDK